MDSIRKAADRKEHIAEKASIERTIFRMNVGINARTFCVDEPGGAIKTGRKLTEAVAQHIGIHTILLGSSRLRTDFPGATVDSRWFPEQSQMLGLIWERTVLPRRARRYDLDVLYCPNGNGLLHDPGYPVVLCIHDVNAQKGLSHPVHRLYRKLAVPRAAQVADAIVTVSEFSKREIVDVLGVPSSKVNVVYNGVDEYFHDDSSGEPLELPDDYLLYVGAINPRKNVERLVAAYRRFREETDFPHKLVLIGPPNKMIFKNVDVRADEDILLPGFVSKTQLKYAYRNAAVFVFPSLYEGFGLPPLEAMACGTPVVAANTTALPEMLGDAAEYVDPEKTSTITQGIKRVLTNATYRRELSEKGRERSAEFTWDRAGRDLLSVFEDVIQG